MRFDETPLVYLDEGEEEPFEDEEPRPPPPPEPPLLSGTRKKARAGRSRTWRIARALLFGGRCDRYQKTSVEISPTPATGNSEIPICDARPLGVNA